MEMNYEPGQKVSDIVRNTIVMLQRVECGTDTVRRVVLEVQIQTLKDTLELMETRNRITKFQMEKLLDTLPDEAKAEFLKKMESVLI